MRTNGNGLTQDERLHKIESILVWHPEAKRCMAELDLAFRTSHFAAEPKGIAVLGHRGVGKTTLMKEFGKKHPRKILEEKTLVPFVSTTIPAKPTVKSLLAGTLAALGDPAYNQGSTGNQEQRLKDFLEQCETRMIHFDEMNHFVDHESQRILFSVSNTVKNVIKDTGVACVFTGLKYSDQIFQANPQLGELFGTPFVLEPFAWNEDVDDGHEFREFVVHLEQGLPLKHRTYFTSRSASRRCFVACSGNLRLLMRLVRRAAQECVFASLDGLNDEVMAYAFDIMIAHERQGIGNPFLTDHIPEFCPLPDDEIYLLKLKGKKLFT